MQKNIYHLFILVFALAVFAPAGVYAQRALKQSVKGIPAASRAAEAAARNASRAAARPWVLSGASTEFLTQHQRAIIGTQRMLGVSKIQAVRNIRAWGAQRLATSPRPVLANDLSFHAPRLGELAARQNAAKEFPPFPFDNQRMLIYRGLALDTDGKAIRNILENGLRTQDVGREASTLALSLAGPMSRSAAVRAPITNLTDSASDAVMWAGIRLSKGQIPVIVVVKSPQKGNIITTSRDIPAEDIYAAVTLLNVNGIPTWCKVELEGDGFRITPYEPHSAPEQP